MNRRTFITAATGAVTLPGFAKTTCLAEHRIAAIEYRTVNLSWPRHVGRNSSKGLHGRGPARHTVCLLKTDQGAMGWGQMQGNRRGVEAQKDQLIGKRVSELIDPAHGIRQAAWHALDVPLHDLAGVILGLPVWQMMGGDKPQLSKVYSGMIYFDDLDPEDKPSGIEKVLENCAWDRDYGYRQLKVKIGRGNKWMPPAEGLKRDIEVVRAIHASFPDCEILVDGNNGFTVETCIRFLEGIGDIPLFWIEEPFHETLVEWRALKAWLVAHGREKTYRADGEARPDFPVLEQLEKDRTLTMRLNDICGYGFTKWRALMPTLKAGGIAASPHTWGSALKTVYTAHLAAAYGNTPTIEGVTSADSDVDFGENRIVAAYLHPSSRPGFGLGLPAA
jgi:D-galactarolactone cycloisomerase